MLGGASTHHWSLIWVCLAVPVTVSAQSPLPKPVHVSKGPIRATCQWGASKAAPTFARSLIGTDPVQSAMSVPRLLSRAGLAVHDKGPFQWIVGPVSAWPDTLTDPAILSTPHPGVYAELIMIKVADSTAVMSRVEAVCAAPPSAPDSTVQVAQRLLAEQVTAALTASQPLDQ